MQSKNILLPDYALSALTWLLTSEVELCHRGAHMELHQNNMNQRLFSEEGACVH